jgi:hypothetical protein
MRRALVLTNEGARHPFRRQLPPPTFTAPAREPLTDTAFFVMSFISGFIIFFGMIV